MSSETSRRIIPREIGSLRSLYESHHGLVTTGLSLIILVYAGWLAYPYATSGVSRWTRSYCQDSSTTQTHTESKPVQPAPAEPAKKSWFNWPALPGVTQ